jgi:hypothetical protein
MTPDPLMPYSQTFAPPNSFVDPRTRPDFAPHCWPLYNGHDAPASEDADWHELCCLEFLAAYYEVNCRQTELQNARAGGLPETEIRTRLDAVATALEAIDTLEDRYAPIGFYGEPVMDGEFYRSIHFHRPELPRLSSSTPSLSSHLMIPGLDEIPPEELQGPIVVTRISHGKVDL